jgi:hypothetical protein
MLISVVFVRLILFQWLRRKSAMQELQKQKLLPVTLSTSWEQIGGPTNDTP